MIFWPLEDKYTIVLDSKIVAPKDPAIDDAVKVKEGGKVFDGKLAAVGSKGDVEAKLIELESKKSKGSAATTEKKSHQMSPSWPRAPKRLHVNQNKVRVNLHVMHANIQLYTTCMYLVGSSRLILQCTYRTYFIYTYYYS